MNKCRLTFNVNSLAMAAAMGAMDDEEHIKKTVDVNYQSLDLISSYCEKNHLTYIPSSANFIFVDTGKNAEKVYQKLLERSNCKERHPVGQRNLDPNQYGNC